MQDRPRLNYCANWGGDRRRTWSGTTWSLEQALGKRFAVSEVDLSSPTFSDRLLSKVRRVVGAGDFDLGFLRKEQRIFDRAPHPKADVWFQFGEIPRPIGGERHYVYQDLVVEWLARCMRNDPETFAWTGFAGMTEKAMELRAELQRELYERAAGVFTMGRWLADFLVDEMGLPAEKVHHAGGGYKHSWLSGFGFARR